MAVGAAIVWLALLFQAAVVLRGDGDGGTRWHVAGFAALASALTMNLAPVYTGFDDLVGVPNLAELFVHGLALLAGWCAHAAIVMSLYVGAAVRRRIVGSAAVLALTLSTMTALFLAAPVDVEVLNFTTTYATTPYIAEYFLAYLTFATLALADIALVTWRYRRSTGTLVAVGLRLLAIGAACGLAYVVHKVTYMVLSRWTEVNPDVAVVTVASHVALVFCAVLCVTGATLPRWGEKVVGVAAWAKKFVTYQRLRPLWRTLTEACPNVVLGSPRAAWFDAVDPRSMDFRLYRRMIEIRDCQIELRAYVREDAVQRTRAMAAAAGWHGEQLEALSEAASLNSGLVVKQLGETGGGWTPGEQAGPTDLASEAARLLLVSKLVRTLESEPLTADPRLSHA